MNIELQPLTKNYIELVRNWRNDPNISKYMYNQDYITKEMQEKWWEKINNLDTEQYFLIFYNSQPVGLVSIKEINYKEKSCSWGFYKISNNSKIGVLTEYSTIMYLINMGFDNIQCELFERNANVLSLHIKFNFYIIGNKKINNSNVYVLKLDIKKFLKNEKLRNLIKKIL